jgi:hypothetical protein
MNFGRVVTRVGMPASTAPEAGVADGDPARPSTLEDMKQ